MNHGYLVYSAYIRPLNIGQRKFAAHMPLAFGSGHMRCKLPLTSILGSYICGIHHVTMTYIYYISVTVNSAHLTFASRKDNQEPASAHQPHCTATKCHHLAVRSVALNIPAACRFTASASPWPFWLCHCAAWPIPRTPAPRERHPRKCWNAFPAPPRPAHAAISWPYST